MGLLRDLFVKQRQASPKRLPTAAATVLTTQGKVYKAHAALFRNWAEHSEWVRAAINLRRTQVSSAEWDIVAFDPDIRVDNRRLQKKIQALFDRPNPMNDSFRSWIEPIVEDILVLDAGAIEKTRSYRGEPRELYAVDGAQVRVSSVWDGDPDEPRYFWYPDGFERARWTNDEMVYIMENPRTYVPVGLSKMETLKMTIDADIAGHEYNRRQVLQAAPDGIFDLGEGIRPEQVEEFEEYWHSEVAGRGAIAFIGGSKNAKFIPFRANNRDMQFMEWQLFLVRKIAAVFGISPQDLGLTMDVNRANSEVMQENTEDRGLRPLMSLIQDYLTREIVWDPAFGGVDNNLAFRFTSLNLKESLDRAKINELALAGVPWKTLNEARKDEGREPLPDGDVLMFNTSTGVVKLEDVPTAREVLDAKKPALTPTGAPGSNSASPRSKPKSSKEK
jgi:HK97 family phage portal protein